MLKQVTMYSSIILQDTMDSSVILQDTMDSSVILQDTMDSSVILQDTMVVQHNSTRHHNFPALLPHIGSHWHPIAREILIICI